MITKQNIFGLDDNHVVACQQGHRLQVEVAQAFSRMQQAAKADGVDCQIASSYRSFAQQQVIWQKKWLGEKILLDINEQILPFNSLSDEQKLDAILTWSALPGASRHHWGTDLDVYDQQSIMRSGQALQLIQQEYLRADGPCYRLNQWLDQHANQFGFNRPFATYSGGVAAEPWHLSYAAIASKMSIAFDIEALKNALIQAHLPGLELVLPNLEDIYQRFILNKGHV
jgi:LAS superfamily LD-carboxypeptidase LdcB